MCNNSDRTGSLLTGVVLGAAIGVGVTFLFGTNKGKEIREKVRDQYPEFFDQVGDVLDNLGDKYEDVVDEVRKLEKEVTVKDKVANLGKAVEHLGKQLESVSKPRRFQRAGRKL